VNSLPADEIAETPFMTKPWTHIQRAYRGMVDAGLRVDGMLRLVKRIEASRYARALHAWTSMHDLCIVQVPCCYPDYLPFLRISPLFDGTVEFRYIDTLIEEKQWRRRVNEEDAFRRLERFIDQLRWAVRERAATS
jgi:hypothetical protein